MPGLTAAEAAARLARNGPNVLPEPGRKSGLALAGHVLREPMLLLLLAVTRRNPFLKSRTRGLGDRLGFGQMAPMQDHTGSVRREIHP